MNEIQELRGLVEMLQNTLTYKTDKLERYLESVMESKSVSPVASESQQTPTSWSMAENVPLIIDDKDYPSLLAVPGTYPQADQAEIADVYQDMLFWYRMMMRKHRPKDLFFLLICFWICCSTAILDLETLIPNLVLAVLSTC